MARTYGTNTGLGNDAQVIQRRSEQAGFVRSPQTAELMQGDLEFKAPAAETGGVADGSVRR